MNEALVFFAYLRYCLGYKGNMSRVIASMNWQELYSFASKQAILGLCFDGIERIGKEYPEELKLNYWEGTADDLDGKDATDSPTEHEGEYCGG